MLLLTHPLLPLLVLALAAVYAVGVRRVQARGLAWRPARTAAFATGLAGLLAVWAAEPVGHRLVWVFTLQVVALLVVVPVFLAYGRPIALASDALLSDRPARLFEGRLARVATSPLVGPLVVPVVLSLVFFTPLLVAAPRHALVGQLLQLVLLVIGALIAVGLVGDGTEREGALALGAAVAVAFGEFLLDAVPGIVLRLETHVQGASYWLTRDAQPLVQQQHAGAVLWFVAEFADLPFLVILVRRWVRADARDAAAVDLELDAQELSRPASADADQQQPWWETDPSRLGGHRVTRRSSED